MIDVQVTLLQGQRERRQLCGPRPWQGLMGWQKMARRNLAAAGRHAASTHRPGEAPHLERSEQIQELLPQHQRELPLHRGLENVPLGRAVFGLHLQVDSARYQHVRIAVVAIIRV